MDVISSYGALKDALCNLRLQSSTWGEKRMGVAQTLQSMDGLISRGNPSFSSVFQRSKRDSVGTEITEFAQQNKK